jgi:hypothetical protein
MFALFDGGAGDVRICVEFLYMWARLWHVELLLTRLSRVAGWTVCWIAGFSQIAGGVVNPSLQRAEDIGDVLGPDGCRVHAANADVRDVDLTASAVSRKGSNDAHPVQSKTRNYFVLE